jgi:hypothetical protein
VKSGAYDDSLRAALASTVQEETSERNSSKPANGIISPMMRAPHRDYSGSLLAAVDAAAARHKTEVNSPENHSQKPKFWPEQATYTMTHAPNCWQQGRKKYYEV